MNIHCEHPVIIENPYLKALVAKYQYVRMGDRYLNLAVMDKIHTYCDNEEDKYDPYLRRCSGEFRNREITALWDSKYHVLFWKTRSGVTLDNIDDYYVISPDGETFPVYMAVPCGHCTLCRDHKSKEWMTRCLCETATSEYPPLFITLTYRNEDLPSDGVSKSDVDDFMKRFRMRVNRHFNAKFNLRFLLVAEYGSNTHRAHYHMLLWNMPFLPVADGKLSSWETLHDFIQDAWSHGWIGLDRCKDASGKYCMKYMRKDCYVPEGCNPTFMKSSRRRGIGYEFAASQTAFFREHPDCATMCVTNPFDGSVTNCVIPSYFKRIWFPSLSAIVKQEIRDAVSTFCHNVDMLVFAYHYFSSVIVDKNRARYKSLLDDVVSMHSNIESKYYYCVENWLDSCPDSLQHKDFYSQMRRANTDKFWFYFDLKQDYCNLPCVAEARTKVDESYNYLMSFNINPDDVTFLLELHSQHSILMRLMAEQMPEVNVLDEVAKVKRDNARLLHTLNPDDDCYLLEESEK